MARGGAALAVAYTFSPLARAAAAAAPAPGFTARRRATFRAMLGALGAGGAAGIDTSRSSWAVDDFARSYSQRLPENQREVDAILDALERSPADGGFSRMRHGEGLRHLHGIARGTRPERDLYVQATALAALPFSATDDDDPPAVPVVL